MVASSSQPAAAPPPKPSLGRRLARVSASLGRSLYLAMIQGMVGLVWLATVLYLAVNSPSTARIASELTSQVLPGDLRVASLRLGPVVAHGELRVRLEADRLVLREPLGEVVLSARRLVAEIAPSRLIDGLRAGALRLSLPRLDLHSPLLVLDNDAKGRMRLVTAFVDFDQPPDPKAEPMPVWLRVGAVKVRDASFRMVLPAIEMEGSALDFDSSGAQVDVPVGGSTRVQYAAQRVVAGYFSMSLDSMRLLPPIPSGSLQIDRVEGDLERVQVVGVSAQMPALDWRKPLAEPAAVIARARIDVEMGEDLSVSADHMELAMSTRLSFLGDMLGDLFDATSTVIGQFRFDLVDGFWAKGTILGRGLMSGFETESVSGTVEVETGSRGDAAVRVITTDVIVHTYGGWLSSPRVEYKMALDRPEHQVRGEFKVDGMRGDLPLRAKAVGLTGLVPMLASGTLTGQLGTLVRIHLPTGRPLDMDVALDADLSLDRDTFLAFIQQPLPRVEWRGGMRMFLGPDATGAQQLMVTLDRSRLRAEDANGGGELLLDVQADGALDLTGSATRLALSMWMPRMQAWLQPLGLPGYQGSLRLESGKMDGKMMAWDAQGALSVGDLVTPWLKVRRATARMTLQAGILGLHAMQVATEFGQAHGDFSMGLFGSNWAVLRAQQPLLLKNFEMPSIDLAKAQAALNLTGLPRISGLASLRGGRVAMDAKNAKSTLQLSGVVAARQLDIAGERIESLSGQVELIGQRAVLQDGRLRRRGDPADGTQDLRLAGRYHLANGSFEGEIDLPMLQLSSLPSLGDLPMRGKFGLVAKAKGDAGGLELDADVMMEDLAWDKIPIGSAKLRVVKTRDGPAVLSSSSFFQNFSLMPGSQVTFKGMAPTGAQLRVATVGSIDPIRRLGMEKLPGMQIRLEGEVATTLEIDGKRLDWRVDAAVPSGGLWVDMGSGVRPIRNTSVLLSSVTANEIGLSSTYFEVEGTPVELCGALLPQGDGRPLHLLAFVAGTLAVPRWGPIGASVASMDVQFDILPDPVVKADKRSECLQGRAGRLRVEGGFPGDPMRVQGVLRSHASSMVLRGLGEVTIAEGGRLYLATNSKGIMSLLIPTEQPLSMHLMDGDLTTSGTVRVQGDKLLSANLRADGRELLIAKPKEYQLSVAPQVTLVGTDMDDPENRSITLSGKVKVTDGTVSKPFNATTEVIANVTDRKVESYSKPLTETMPLLAELQLDLDVVMQGIEVTSRVSAVKCDVVADGALKVGGTLTSIELRNNINVVEGSGSQVSMPYNNLVFDVERGVLEFEGDPATPLIDALARIDIPVKAGSRSSSTATLSVSSELTSDSTQSTEIVQVYVGIKGHWGEKDMALKFSSNKGDSEADVQCLLAFRRRCNDEGGPGMRLTTDFLIGDTVNRAVLAVFQGLVDTLTFDFDALNLGFNAEVVKKFGKNISMGTRVQTGKENRYDADFSFRITDRLSLNGLWRRTRPLDTSTNSQTTIDTYESKLRYKVVLDE